VFIYLQMIISFVTIHDRQTDGWTDVDTRPCVGIRSRTVKTEISAFLWANVARSGKDFIRPPDDSREVLYFTAVSLFSVAPQVYQTAERRGWVRSSTKKIMTYRHFTHPFPRFYSSEKMRNSVSIFDPSRSRVTSFRSGATYLNCKRLRERRSSLDISCPNLV